MSEIVPRSSIEEIRARTSQPVTEIVSNPREYYRVQQLLRDRLDLLAHYDELAADAARWRALVKSTGHEFDTSSGPGTPKDIIIRINCTGCVRWFESGAPDFEGTLTAAIDDEIRLQGSQVPTRAE